MKKTNKKGFTIVELVIVIAVIAILAAVLIPTFSNVVAKAQNSAAIQAARNAYTEFMSATNATLPAGTTNFTNNDNAELAAIETETGVTSAAVTLTDGKVTSIEFTLTGYTVTYTPANDTPWVAVKSGTTTPATTTEP